MTSARLHTHPCTHCGSPTDCTGTLAANDDGWPVVICEVYHLDGGQTDDRFLCESCLDAEVKQMVEDVRRAGFNV